MASKPFLKHASIETLLGLRSRQKFACSSWIHLIFLTTVTCLTGIVACGDEELIPNPPAPVVENKTHAELFIESPAQGLFITDDGLGKEVSVSVRVTRPDLLNVLTINGKEITIDKDGRAQTTYKPVRGLNAIEAKATFKNPDIKDDEERETFTQGRLHHFLYGIFDPKIEAAQVVNLKLLSSGFQPLANVIKNILLKQFYDPAMFPLEVSGGDTCEKITIQKVEFDGIDVVLKPVSNLVNFEAVIDSNEKTRFKVFVDAHKCDTGVLGTRVSVKGTASADFIRINSKISAQTGPSDLIVDFSDSTIFFEKFDVKVDKDLLNLAGLFENRLKKEIEKLFTEEMTKLGPTLSQALSGLFGRYEALSTTVTGERVTVFASVTPHGSENVIFPSGAYLDLDVKLDVNVPIADNYPPAYFSTAEGNASFGPYDAGLFFPLDLFNQALHRVWATGKLKSSFDITDKSFALGDPLYNGDDNKATKVTLDVDLKLPPIIVATGNPELPLSIEVGATELILKGQLPGEKAETVRVESTVGLSAPLNFIYKVGEDGKAIFSLKVGKFLIPRAHHFAKGNEYITIDDLFSLVESFVGKAIDSFGVKKSTDGTTPPPKTQQGISPAQAFASAFDTAELVCEEGLLGVQFLIKK